MSNIYHAAAPCDQQLFGVRLNSDWQPIACNWRFYDQFTTVTTDLATAIDEATNLSEANMKAAWTVVEIVSRGPTGPFAVWAIDRTLPVLAYRGDLYQTVECGSFGDFLKELA